MAVARPTADRGPWRRAVGAVDAWQRRHPVGGLPVGVLKKFSDDRGSSLAALIAFYAFFSLFPLLLALVSVLGFVLEGNPSLRDDVLDTALAGIPVVGDQLRDDVIDTALERIPVIGAELRDDVHPLTGRAASRW